MRFHVYVDPTAAIQAGNDAFGHQIATILLSALTSEEREAVARHSLIQDGVICLTQVPNVYGITLHKPAATADLSTIREIISGHLEAEQVAATAEAWAKDHAPRALADAAASMPLRTALQEFPDRFVEHADRWLATHYPAKWPAVVALFEAVASDDLRTAPKVSAFEQVVPAFGSAVCVYGGRPLRMPRIDWDHPLHASRFEATYPWCMAGLPDHPAGRVCLSTTIERRLDDDAALRVHWEACLAARFAELAGALVDDMCRTRAEIEARLDELLEADAEARRVEAQVHELLEAVDREAPERCMVARYRAGALPPDERRAVLRAAAFAPLDDFRRFKRIQDSEVKRKRRTQRVHYTSSVAKTATAKHFTLAAEIARRLPAASIAHVVDSAYVDDAREPALQRHAVSVRLKYLGEELEREYVAD